MEETVKDNKNHKAVHVLGAVIGNSALLLVTTLFIFVVFLFSVILILTHGPSERARYIFVNSCNETSALKFLPYWFLNDDEVDRLLTGDGGGDDYIELKYRVTEARDADSESAFATEIEEELSDDGFEGGIKIEDIFGDTYRGKIMLIKDPSRITVGVLPSYSEDAYGKYLYKFIEDNGAVGGINGGGFADEEGKGRGGCPDGFVIKNGKIIYGEDLGVCNNFVGFDKDHKMMLKSCTAAQAIKAGAVEGITFEMGSVLVRDGNPAKKLGGGYNPRTAIGQKADGTVIMVVIEGRHAASLGATRDDLVDIMVEYGAENATMLDGGSSAEMRYNGEQLTRGSGLIGMRGLPNAILIMPEVTE
ncbi:MAG: phosphodiester glycosidase family protein [Lachnospiraceae bacterium]|nr:phosphodiester glycosidase family protein [Lachnospiraceae bacterium]